MTDNIKAQREMNMRTHRKPKYAVFKQFSKAHSTREAAMVEAYESGLVLAFAADMPGDLEGKALADGYLIAEIKG